MKIKFCKIWCGVLAGWLLAIDGIAATTLFRNGVIHPVSAPALTDGELLLRDGKIEKIGKSLGVKADQEVDLQGMHVFPGLIVSSTVLGLQEINAVRATRDSSEVGEFTPDVFSWDAVNPDSELLPVARANGITHFLPVPTGALLSGHSGLLKLDGWTPEEMSLRKPVGLHLFWPAMELDTRPKEEWADKTKFKSLEDQSKDRTARLKSIDDFFQEAEAYVKQIQEARPETKGFHPAWEAMRPFITGKIPLFVHADSVREIQAALKWAKERNYRLVIVGGREAWRIAAELARDKVAVIYEHVFTQPIRATDSFDVYFRAPGILRQAGVTVAISQGLSGYAASNARNLPYLAAHAAAYGLPRDEALKSMTLYPAQIFGVESQLGSLEPGKEATFLVSNGDILDVRSQVKRMWINGKEVSLDSRHTRLYEKYRQRPKPTSNP